MLVAASTRPQWLFSKDGGTPPLAPTPHPHATANPAPTHLQCGGVLQNVAEHGSHEGLQLRLEDGGRQLQQLHVAPRRKHLQAGGQEDEQRQPKGAGE
jgi:hypothetical protein